MLRAFREKTADAYGYAIVDAVNTLLVHERMAEMDREIYASFDVPDAEIPPMKAHPGQSRGAVHLPDDEKGRRGLGRPEDRSRPTAAHEEGRAGRRSAASGPRADSASRPGRSTAG